MSRLSKAFWLASSGVLACGVEPKPGERSVEVVRDFSDPADGRRFANVWRFEDGSALSDVVVSPANLVPGQIVRIAFSSDADCGGRIGLLPPRVAARQEVYRGKPLDIPPDGRAVWAELAEASGVQTIELTLPRPWHPKTAVAVLERRCSGRLVAVAEGPRRERLDEGHPQAGGYAVLATADVERHPTEVSATRLDVDVDGALGEWTEPSWGLVSSLDGEPATDTQTRVRFAWNDQALFVAGDLEDQDVWTEHEKQDDPLYRQEAFEVFVAADDSGNGYVEYQVSSRNVTFDSRFPEYRKGDEAWDSAWTTAVDVRGTVNDNRDRDEGWTVEVAIPWTEICEQTQVECPPKPGRTLRVNVFRLDKPDRKRQRGFALSPTLVPDFHAWKNAAVLVLEG